MSYVDDWKKLKKIYDARYEAAAKELKVIGEEYDAAIYYRDGVQKGKVNDEKYMKKISKFVKRFDPVKVNKIISNLTDRRLELLGITKRERFGLEPTLTDIEKLLTVAEKMVAKKVVDEAKWKQYQKMYDTSGKKLMKAVQKARQFGNVGRSHKYRNDLIGGVEDILRKVDQRARAIYRYYQENVKA